VHGVLAKGLSLLLLYTPLRINQIDTEKRRVKGRSSATRCGVGLIAYNIHIRVSRSKLSLCLS
jgi:hypothetical protein